ncbi:MAG: hypothetical protein Q4B42_04925 [Oscillospiraceae bacterium]|nr:hypothetical protein [Oscillospiraceae bacterium]
MLCKHCKNELAISASFTQAETDANGATKIFSVVDLKCTDENCPEGRRGLPAARLKRLIVNSAPDGSAASCCGVPLAYLAEDSYRLPDEALLISESETELRLRCPGCAKETRVNIEGREKI